MAIEESLPEGQQDRVEAAKSWASIVREQRLLQDLFAQVPSAIAVFSGPEHRLEFANPMYERLSGRSLHQHRGRPAREIFPELADQPYLDFLDQVFATGEPVSGSESPARIDRRGLGQPELGYFNFSFLPLRRPSGEVEGVLVHAVDVTEQVESRRWLQEVTEALATERARLSAILQQLPVGVLIAEAPSGRVVLWNEQVETILGHPLDAPASVEAYGAWTAYWPDGRPVRPDEWPLARATVAGEVVSGAEVEFVLPGGRRRWLSINAAPIRDADGRIVAGVVTFYDIDDRKRSEQALRESEDRFRAFFDHAVVGMSLADPSGRLIQVNQAYCDILGYSAEELLALDYRAITHPDDLAENEARVRDLLEGRAPTFAMEKRYVGKGGRVVHARVSASLVRGPAGEPRYFVAITEDVSVRKAAEEALRESEERLRVAAEATGLGAWDFYPTTGELIWSDRCKALFGLAPEAEVDYPTFLALVHPEDRERVDAVVRRALDPASGGAYSVEYRTAIGAESGPRWLSAVGRTFFDAEGRAVRFIGTVHDITERKRAEEERIQRVEQLRALAEASLVLNATRSVEEILDSVIAQARAIIGAHQAVASLTRGPDFAQAINAVSLSDKYASWRDYDAVPDGSGIYRLVCAENRPMRLTQAELEAHPAWRGFGAAAGQHPPLRGWLAAPLIGRDGRNLGLIQLSDKYEGEFSESDEAILVQLAQMASVALENARLYEETQDALQMRDEVLSMVSHDLKNPLATIKGYAQWMKRQAEGPKSPDLARMAQNLGKIDELVTRMTALIDEQLDLTRLRLGREIELNRAPTDLVALATALVAEHQRTTERHRFRVEALAGEVVGVWDALRLGRVLGNLLSNAVKYSPDGGEVCVRVGREGEEWAWLAVEDHGIGIAPEDLPHVFTWFRRGRNVGHGIRGSGVGLASAKQIVEQHGGRIEVESAEGQGSTFTVWLPLGEPEPEAG